MKQAIGYVRVSTGRQANEGVSLDAQQEAIKAWCDRNGYDLVNVFQDAGQTGTKMKNRPGLQNALHEIQKDTVLVFYSLSRLSRSMQDMLRISGMVEKSGGQLVSVTENFDTTTPSGEMVFGMLSLFAQYESKIISERTTNALRHKKAKREVYSNVIPFGFKAVNKKLVEVEQEMKVVKRMIKQRNQGMTLRAIANQLNQQGVATRKGGTWQANTVRKVINNGHAMNMN
jgi:site-specific DNA recombinase